MVQAVVVCIVIGSLSINTAHKSFINKPAFLNFVPKSGKFDAQTKRDFIGLRAHSSAATYVKTAYLHTLHATNVLFFHKHVI